MSESTGNLQDWSVEIEKAMKKYGYETENHIEAIFSMGWGKIIEHFPEGVTNEYGMTYSYMMGGYEDPLDFIDLYFRLMNEEARKEMYIIH